MTEILFKDKATNHGFVFLASTVLDAGGAIMCLQHPHQPNGDQRGRYGVFLTLYINAFTLFVFIRAGPAPV